MSVSREASSSSVVDRCPLHGSLGPLARLLWVASCMYAMTTMMLTAAGRRRPASFSSYRSDRYIQAEKRGHAATAPGSSLILSAQPRCQSAGGRYTLVSLLHQDGPPTCISRPLAGPYLELSTRAALDDDDGKKPKSASRSIADVGSYPGSTGRDWNVRSLTLPPPPVPLSQALNPAATTSNPSYPVGRSVGRCARPTPNPHRLESQPARV